jgi:tRNA nucleotidyltransferase/poly(A) polymerase
MIKIYQVGGSVRDEILGIKSNDIDYSIEILNSKTPYEDMKKYIEHNNYKIFVEKPQFFTIRAKMNKQIVDFSLCRS